MNEAEKLEFEIMEKAQKLAKLRRNESGTEVTDYEFQTLTGATTLSELFAGRDRLLMIHNMGQGCSYCTLWADGINGVLGHLEDAMAVALVSKDPPETQRQMALDRGWKFRTASHGGGAYMAQQCAMGENANYPGAVIYERSGNKIVRRGGTFFGPGDLYSPVWHFLALAGLSPSDWEPQYQYWKQPENSGEGCENNCD